MKYPARTIMGFGNLMNSLTLQQQLRLMTGISLIGMLVVVVFVMSSLYQLRHEFSDYQAMQLTDKDLIEINATALAISRADPILPDTAARLDEADTHIQALHQRLAGLPGKPELGKQELDKLLGEISGKWNAYVQGFKGAIKIARDNPNDALMIPDSLFTMHLAPMTKSVENFIAANKASEIASEEKITSVMSKILWIVLLPMILLGAMTLVTQTLFGLHLRQRLDGIVGEINHLHNGDLTRRLPATNHDEIGHLSRTINNFIARFETILHGVYASAEHAHNTAAEVSLMAHSVTKNAKEQSTRVFEVSNAIEGMGGTVRKIAESASNASGITKQALAMVHSGGETGQATIAALGKIDHTVATSAATIAELNTAIQRIGSVSGSIKDIAEQTNLLALNAAIEAARAGEQGRGFAVVADEVRKLAGRTTSATADITQIVQDIENKIQQAIHAMDLTQQEVSQGVLFGETMGKLLDQIEASVQTVTGLMDQIASATEDQSSAGEHISRNISTVADISADTAANIELAHNEMSSLAKTSKTLYETVGQFKLAA